MKAREVSYFSMQQTEKYWIIFLLLKGAALDWYKIHYTKVFSAYSNAVP